jgi:hypothetical protein
VKTLIYSISGPFGFHLSKRPEMYRIEHGTGALYPACSRAFICPFCRKPWAEIKIDGRPIGEEEYELVACPCERCGKPTRKIGFSDRSLHPIPGSLLDGGVMFDIDWGLLETMPEELLKRELLLHIKAIENEHSSSSGSI